MRIGFTQKVRYENEAPHKGPVFDLGEVYDCTEEFANRWIARGVAVAVAGGKALAKGARWAKVENHGWSPDDTAADETEAAASAADARAADADALIDLASGNVTLGVDLGGNLSSAGNVTVAQAQAGNVTGGNVTLADAKPGKA